DRWVGLLNGAGPRVHVAQLRVLAVEGEGLFLRPGPDDQVVGLAVLVAQGDRRLAVGVVRVHGGADGKARDQAATTDDVQHGEFFRHSRGWVVQGQGIAEYYYGGVRRTTCQGGGHQVWGRHHSVSILVMFVDADAVESHL